MTQPVDLAAALAGLSARWSPRTVATLTTTTCAWSRRQGEFTRHSHLQTGEVFLVLTGTLTLRLDGCVVRVSNGVEGSGWVLPWWLLRPQGAGGGEGDGEEGG